MPGSVNGIGTSYYGKRNIHRIRITCSHCQKLGDLESYDTTLYFMVFFIPCIPVGQKRILEQCPACKTHRVLNLSEWEASKKKAVSDALQECLASPHDPKPTVNALMVATGYQDRELFEQLIPMTQSMPLNAEVQESLGHAYAYFGEREAAVTAYKAALKLEDREIAREGLAETYLRNGEPDLAEPLLKHVIDNQKLDSVWMVYQLIRIYQSSGQHAKVLEWMDKRDKAFPSLLQDKKFLKENLKERAFSQKHLETNKPYKVQNIADNGKGGIDPGRGTSSLLAKLAMPLVLLTAFLICLGISLSRANHAPVYLVNGLNKPYKVMVNDVEMELPALARKKLDIPEGTIRVTAFLPGLIGEESFVATYENSMFERLDRSHILVLNPDRLALVEFETTVYSKNPGVNPPPVLYHGVHTHRIPWPDYLFEPFPPTLTVNASQTITKKRISTEVFNDLPSRILYLQELKGDQGILEDMQRFAMLEPDSQALSVALAKLPLEASKEYLKQGMDKRPLEVNWHRMYQSLMEREGKLDSIIPVYESLEKELKDSAAKYLLARVISDPARELQLLNEAIQGEKPTPYAFYSLGYRQMANGQFSEALSNFKAADKGIPGNLLFWRMMPKAYLANRQYEEALNSGNSDLATLATAAYHLGKERLNTLVMEKKNQVMQLNLQNKVQNANVQIAGLQNRIDAFAAAARRDIPVFLHMSNDQAELQVVANLLQNKLAEADALIQTLMIDEQEKMQFCGACYYVALQGKKSNDIPRLKANFVQSLRNLKSREFTLVANALEKGELTPAMFKNLNVEPEEKRVILFVASLLLTNDQKALEAEAQKLNFLRDPISLVFPAKK